MSDPEAEGTYFVMELVEGETLAERLRRGPLAVDQTVEVGLQIASALETSIEPVSCIGTVPANVMLTPSGVKLLDFGIARFAPLAAMPLRDTATATQTDPRSDRRHAGVHVAGAVDGEEADARSDLFSFGAVLYEMVTGWRAFAAETPARVTAVILSEDPPSILSTQPTAPRELDRLIRTCLVKNPADRWQSARICASSLAGSRTGCASRSPAHAVVQVLADSGSPPALLEEWPQASSSRNWSDRARCRRHCGQRCAP